MKIAVIPNLDKRDADTYTREILAVLQESGTHCRIKIDRVSFKIIHQVKRRLAKSDNRNGGIAVADFVFGSGRGIERCQINWIGNAVDNQADG